MRPARAAGSRGGTVSTLKEVAQFFAAGFDDMLYAVCIAPPKLAAARALRESGCRLTAEGGGRFGGRGSGRRGQRPCLQGADRGQVRLAELLNRVALFKALGG